MNTPAWFVPSAYRTGQALANGERDRTEPDMFSPVERATASMVKAGACLFITLAVVLLSTFFAGWALLPTLGVGAVAAVFAPWMKLPDTWVKMPGNGNLFGQLFNSGILMVPTLAYLDKGAFAGVLTGLWWGVAVWLMVCHMGKIRAFGQMDSQFDPGEYDRRKADVERLRGEAAKIEQTYRP